MRTKITTNKSTIDVPAFTDIEVKQNGKVYTPMILVDDILKPRNRFQDYTRRVCDPSMGQGNFLRLIFEQRLLITQSADKAFQYIFGFEIDKNAIINAREWFISRGVSSQLVDKNLIHGDALINTIPYYGTMDDVIGNPPYVRSPQHLPDHITLCENLADSFFQVGMNLLKPGPNTYLLYITQDSFITNEKSTLRQYLVQFNKIAIEHRFDYSQLFRKHDIAVDIALVEIENTTIHQSTVNVHRHIPFTLPQDGFTDNKWLIYPPKISSLATKLTNQGIPLSTLCTVKKGRTVNSNAAVPAAYGSSTYSKQYTATFSIPVLSEPNTGYYFPTSIEPVCYGKSCSKHNDDATFTPFIILPYFTSKFRFCIIEQDILTTPLLYVLSGQDIKWLLPILNSSVIDFVIRYYTKSRDTGYEFKSTTFDTIKIPNVSDTIKEQLDILVEMVRNKELNIDQVDQYLMTTIFNLTDEEQSIIKFAKEFWFKKNIKTLLRNEEYQTKINNFV